MNSNNLSNRRKRLEFLRRNIWTIRRSTLGIPNCSPFSLYVRFDLLDVFRAFLKHVNQFLSIFHPLPLIKRTSSLPQIFPRRHRVLVHTYYGLVILLSPVTLLRQTCQSSKLSVFLCEFSTLVLSDSCFFRRTFSMKRWKRLNLKIDL